MGLLIAVAVLIPAVIFACLLYFRRLPELWGRALYGARFEADQRPLLVETHGRLCREYQHLKQLTAQNYASYQRARQRITGEPLQHLDSQYAEMFGCICTRLHELERLMRECHKLGSQQAVQLSVVELVVDIASPGVVRRRIRQIEEEEQAHREWMLAAIQNTEEARRVAEEVGTIIKEREARPFFAPSKPNAKKPPKYKVQPQPGKIVADLPFFLADGLAKSHLPRYSHRVALKTVVAGRTG